MTPIQSTTQVGDFVQEALDVVCLQSNAVIDDVVLNVHRCTSHGQNVLHKEQNVVSMLTITQRYQTLNYNKHPTIDYFTRTV